MKIEGSGPFSKRYGSGSVPKYHGSATLPVSLDAGTCCYFQFWLNAYGTLHVYSYGASFVDGYWKF